MISARTALEEAYFNGLEGKPQPAAGELYLEWERGCRDRQKEDFLPFPLNTPLVVIFKPAVESLGPDSGELWHAFTPGVVVRAKSYDSWVRSMSCMAAGGVEQHVLTKYLSLPNFPAGRRALDESV